MGTAETKKKVSNTTKSFKLIVFHERILPAFKWKGFNMVFPYTWNSRYRCARINVGKLFDIIEWDIK